MSIAPDEIPKQVGRYIIEESIGYGAMGAVYRARDPLISRTVAIKTIRLDVPPASPQYQSFLQRFYTEAKVSGTLSHPNIVTLYDIGETEDKMPFLAMEYVDGETVSDMLDAGKRLKPEQVIGLVSQMASAVDYAHEKGVIHRDIKPSNVIVFDGEKVKITDFGIAKLMDAEGTQTASLLGTPSYMSPEQAMGESLDGRTDIFSLGVVAFEMLSGQQPFPGNNVTSILYKLVHADPVRPSNLEILGLLPDKWHQVFSKVLAKNPPDRYGTAADFVADLEHCQGAWFGALEGDTAVISAPELAEALRDASQADSPPADVMQLSGEGDDETVLLKSDELSTSSETPSPATTEGGDATVPGALPLKDEEMETVLFTPSPEEQQVHTAGPEQVATKDEEVDTETVVLGDTSATATKPPEPTATATTAPGSTDDETVYAPPSPPVEPPTETTKRLAAKSGAKSKTKHLALAAACIFAAFVVVALAVLWMGSRTEVPEYVPPTSPDAVAVPVGGTLIVVSEPEGASVWINGEEQGVTPLEPQFMDLGIHTVRLEREGFKPHELAAELREDQPDVRLEVTMEPMTTAPPPPTRAFLVVQSTPEGAQVNLDGEVIGTTPLQRTSTRPGERTLVLELEGFEPWELDLDLRAGDTETVTATLAPIAEEAPPEPEPPAVQVGELVERGPDVVDPKCVDCPAVSYPQAANERRLEGVVEVSFIVTENGAVQDIQVEESAGPAFDPFVVDVLKNWRFEPATKHGVPVKVRLTRRFRFQRGR